jgi:glycosyltransferase involved in cell wall biosynthesis
MEPVMRVAAIVPVLNEEDAIGGVVAGLRANGVDLVVVIDGNSTDATAERARSEHAQVIVEQRRGYGRALMTGIEALPDDIGIVLFFDGDGTDRTDLVPLILAPILVGSADFAMGTRLYGLREPGSLGVAQVVAGHLAGVLIRLYYGTRFTDMSPFRALRRDTLASLDMQDTTFGWNLEMQMRVAARGLRVVEIPGGGRVAYQNFPATRAARRRPPGLSRRRSSASPAPCPAPQTDTGTVMEIQGRIQTFVSLA